MKPFNPKAVCPKCGDIMKAKYCPAEQATYVGPAPMPERIERFCGRCGYRGDDEACLDIAPSRQEISKSERAIVDTLNGVKRALDSMIEDNPKIDPYVKLVRDQVEDTVNKYNEGTLVVDVPKCCPKCGDMDIPNHLCRNADPLALSGGTSKMRTGGNLRLEGTSTDRRTCQVCGESASPLTLMNDGYWRCYKCVASSVSRTEEGSGQAEESKTKESPSALIKSRGVCVKCGNKVVDLYLIVDGMWTCMICGSVYADSKGGGIPLPLLSGSLKDWMKAIANARLDMKAQIRSEVEKEMSCYGPGEREIRGSYKNLLKRIDRIDQ